MGTEIKTWQIVDGKLTAIDTALKDQGRTEPYDLEPWLASNPEIIGTDIMVIGRQVMTRSGPIDLLGIDRSGNTVIIEIKRAELPRETLAQAIDYASDVAQGRWHDSATYALATRRRHSRKHSVRLSLTPTWRT